jgi:nucleotide-binding universal stress UspA family protein
MNAAPLRACWARYPGAPRTNSVVPRRLERLLVALDGSAFAERVIPFVTRIARSFDAEVLLVRVVSLTPPTIVEGTAEVRTYDVPERLTEARRYLDGIAAKLRERGVRVKVHARYGMPAAQIAAVTREQAVDLIAMATGRDDRLGESGADSTTGAVLREAEVPVLLFGAARREAQAARAA